MQLAGHKPIRLEEEVMPHKTIAVCLSLVTFGVWLYGICAPNMICVFMPIAWGMPLGYYFGFAFDKDRQRRL